MHRLSAFIATAALCFTAVTMPANAQQRYGTWSDPDTAQASQAQAEAANTRLQEFIDKLNRMVDAAEKQRAADPLFLRDLRDLARGYDRPWRIQVLSDSFEDGDFTQNPSWVVGQGRYWIEQGWGLRNQAIPASARQQATESTPQKLSGEEVVGAILGQILNKSSRQQQPTTQPAANLSNDIHTLARISNAFALQIEVSSWLGDGHLEIGVFQGNANGPGYRLVYEPGRPLQLQAVGGRGAAVIDASRENITLEDKKFHAIEWTRSPDGTMAVSVDGQEIIKTTDRRFRDVFNGMRISDTGGDFIVKRIAVMGTE